MIYWIIVAITFFTRDEEDPDERYEGAWELAVPQTGVWAAIVGIIGIVITFIVALLIEKIYKIITLILEKASFLRPTAK